MSFVLIFQVIIEFGFMISATAQISKHRSNSENVSKIITSVIYAKLLLTGVSLLAFLATALFIPIVREHFLIVSLFYISSVATAMLPDFFFRGIEQMKTITIRTVAIRALVLALVILFVKDDSQIVFVPLAFVVANILALVVAFITMRKTEVKLRRVQARDAILSIKDGLMFFFSRLAVSVNQSLGATFLGLKFSPSSLELGIFSGASRISSASEMMIGPVSDSLYPHMINKKDYGLFKKVVSRGVLIWLAICVFAFIFAPQICTIILGSEYAIAGDYLRILLFGNFMAFLSNLFGYNALSPIGQSKHANIALLISAGINVVVFSILWLTNSISLTSVCVVITLSNLVVFTYRALMLYKYRHLIKKSHDS
jgi:O-antigen/teichoic acid export membrane protein